MVDPIWHLYEYSYIYIYIYICYVFVFFYFLYFYILFLCSYTFICIVFFLYCISIHIYIYIKIYMSRYVRMKKRVYMSENKKCLEFRCLRNVKVNADTLNKWSTTGFMSQGDMLVCDTYSSEWNGNDKLSTRITTRKTKHCFIVP